MASTNNADEAAAPAIDKVQITVRSTDGTRRHLEVNGDLSLRTRKDREGVASAKEAYNPPIEASDTPCEPSGGKRKRVKFEDGE